MNKLAFCEMYGREIGKSLWIAAQGESLEKAASAGQEVDAQEAEYIESLLDDAAYHEQQQKIAHNNGAYNALSQVLASLNDETFDKEAFVGQVETALSNIEAAALTPASEDEDAEMYTRMVKGACTMLSHLYDIPVDEDVIRVAAQSVDAQLAGLSGE